MKVCEKQHIPPGPGATQQQRMKASALLSVALLLLLFSETDTHSSESHGGTGDSCGSRKSSTTGPAPITVLVTSSITNTPTKSYTTYVLFRGILIGGLKRLQDSRDGFTFTYTDDPNYGPYLESVNGLPGSTENQTYWEILVKKPDHTIIRPDVGIGCYIPTANDQIILNYNKY